MDDYKTYNGKLWKRLSFNSNKVWVLMNEDKSFFEKENKLLIKYNLKQDYEYLIKKENIKPLSQAIPKKNPKKIKKNKPLKDDHHPSHDQNIVTIYTDGASSGNPGPSGIGAYLIYKNREKKISEYIGNATNNIAELKAIKRALEEMKKFDIPISIYTDSRYCLGVLTQNWKATANKELVAEIKKLINKFKCVKIIKVKGHGGILGNEIADDLATSAIK